MKKTFLLIGAFLLLGISANSFAGVAKKEKEKPASTATSSASATTNPDKLEIKDLKVGTGPKVTNGRKITVHYTGWLTNGKKFDSSLDRSEPFTFRIGGGEVIQGWEKGIEGMQVGGKRKLTIPPSLGYGARDVGNGLIPANSTLVFEVELLGMK